MQSGSTQREKRRQDRKKAVLPIRVRGNDASGKRFEDLAHTLDITPAGARLAGIRHVLKLRDRITVTYRQRRIDFQVMWTKQIEGTGEYQVGIKAMAQDGDAWGLSIADSSAGRESMPLAVAGALA
jgi:hypothetical protein